MQLKHSFQYQPWCIQWKKMDLANKTFGTFRFPSTIGKNPVLFLNGNIIASEMFQSRVWPPESVHLATKSKQLWRTISRNISMEVSYVRYPKTTAVNTKMLWVWMIWDTPILGNHNLVNSKLRTSSPCVLFIGIELAGLIWFTPTPFCDESTCNTCAGSGCPCPNVSKWSWLSQLCMKLPASRCPG